VSVQSFGTYETPDNAAKAYDIGYILFRGTRGKINRPIDDYIHLASGRFHDGTVIPPQVEDAVRRYLQSNKFKHQDKVTSLERITTYFKPDTCPFL
jgi:hypothetical protein